MRIRAQELDQAVNAFIQSGFRDVDAHARLIDIVSQAVSHMFECKIFIYRIHTTKTSTEVRAYALDVKPFRFHLEFFFGIEHGGLKQVDCQVLVYYKNSRVGVNERERNDSVFEVVFERQNDEYHLEGKWTRDAYGEWLSYENPAWDEHEALSHTFDEIDPSPWQTPSSIEINE